MLREELYHLQEPGSYVGEVVKAMGQNKVLVKVHPEGKYVVDLDNIDINDLQPNTRVALRNDRKLHGLFRHDAVLSQGGVLKSGKEIGKLCRRANEWRLSTSWAFSS